MDVKEITNLPVLYDHEFGLLNEYGFDKMMKWMFNATPNWKVIEENNLKFEPEKVVRWSDDVDSIFKDGFFCIGCRTLTDGRTTAFELTMDVNPLDVIPNRTMLQKYMTKDMTKKLIKGLVKAVNDRFPVHDQNNFTDLFKLHWTKAPDPVEPPPPEKLPRSSTTRPPLDLPVKLNPRTASRTRPISVIP